MLARAKGGSILFDEIGDLGEEAQARIVRMLDSFTDNAPRVMASSQADLARKMEEGGFRQDLYYRIGGVTITVPSLRERVDDIPLSGRPFLRPRRTRRPAAAPLRQGSAGPDPRLFLARAMSGSLKTPSAGLP